MLGGRDGDRETDAGASDSEEGTPELSSKSRGANDYGHDYITRWVQQENIRERKH